MGKLLDRISSLADGTRSAEEIAYLVGATPSSVRGTIWLARRNGATLILPGHIDQRRGPQKSPQTVAVIAALQAGRSQAAVAKEYGLNRKRVHKIARAAGVRKRDKAMDVLAYILGHVLPEPNSGCWIWTGTLFRGGYGGMKINGHITPAHRVAWEAYRGPIPFGLQVLHRCDVRCCVNPDHLFVGTHADNMADRNKKGRQMRGERQHLSKLNADAVRAIRADAREHLEIAADYGVHRSIIGKVKRRTLWQHV